MGLGMGLGLGLGLGLGPPLGRCGVVEIGVDPGEAVGAEAVAEAGVGVLAAFVKAGLAASNSEARRQVAGGGLKHGQVIGSTDARGYDINSRPVKPADLAATVFKFLDIDLGTHWINPQGRPTPIVTEGGQPIHELFA